jgi:hypothetical protein
MHDISELVGEVGETPDRFAVGADDDVAQDPGIEIDAAQAGEPATVRRITNPSTPSRVATVSLAVTMPKKGKTDPIQGLWRGRPSCLPSA